VGCPCARLRVGRWPFCPAVRAATIVGDVLRPGSSAIVDSRSVYLSLWHGGETSTFVWSLLTCVGVNLGNAFACGA